MTEREDHTTAGSVLYGRALEVAYQERKVLRAVDINLSHGAVVALMGRSGSGKTTLLRTLAGIVPPDAGQVWFENVEISALGDRERTELRRKHLGFVFQHSMLIPELTAQENVALPLLLAGVGRKVAVSCADEWLARLGVVHRRSAYPSQVSGGEAQRIAIARAMVNQPKIIFADEPTGSLDTENASVVMRELVAVTQEADVAVLLVTHDEHVAAYASRVHLMVDGQIESA